MKKIFNRCIATVFFAGLAACGAYTNIYSYADHTADFTKYKTFAWLPDSGMTAKKDSFRNSAYDNDIIRNNAKNYIAHALSDRGLRVQVDAPDVLMQLVLHNERQQVVRQSPLYFSPYYYHNRVYYPFYYPYYDYYTYYGWGCQDTYCDYPPSVRQTYVQGTITINMFDRKLKKLVWSGSAQGDIYDPSYVQEDVHPAINRIMKKFPIKPRTSDPTPILTKK